ncbi:DUF4304 domain-containing protein [Flavobacterium sp. XGLA_31]|uniref:DUF4304 domain-containing protein n=1 Tax=Flavobacterium sp. XGLA_31 TaxID=3447666 RepID=UPI003F2AAC18
MTAKEIQTKIVKEYLKPRLKSLGYLTSGQNWWKDNGDFFMIIQLQNFSWNSQNKVDFCFNIGISIKAVLENLKKPTAQKMTVHTREGSYLPQSRVEYKYHNKTGYCLTDDVDENKFLNEIVIDFEEHILPELEKIKTIKDCLEKYGEMVFFGDYLKKVLVENNLM